MNIEKELRNIVEHCMMLGVKEITLKLPSIKIEEINAAIGNRYMVVARDFVADVTSYLFLGVKLHFIPEPDENL